MSDDYPPTGDQVPEVPPVPEATARPKINWVFFLLGFIAPAAAALVQGLVLSGVAQLQAFAPLGMLSGLLQLAVIVVATWAFVTGRSTGDNRRRSFGLGAFASFAVSALVLLLAFGACLVSLGTGGNFLGG